MKRKTEYVEGAKAHERFEHAMGILFKAPKATKHKPTKRKKKGKD